jgi:hypothetical protein
MVAALPGANKPSINAKDIIIIHIKDLQVLADCILRSHGIRETCNSNSRENIEQSI